MEGRYWQYHPDAPFAVLMRIVETYCHPEISADNGYEEFQQIVHMPERDPIFDRFKDELREAILAPQQLPEGALSRAAEYEDGSPEKFLARLWHDLYPDEPLPAR